MRRILSPCLATTALLALAVVAPAGAHAKAKPPKSLAKPDPALFKQVKAAYAVFRTPKAPTDVVTGLKGVRKAERRRIARAESRYLANVSGVTFYAMVTGKQFTLLSVPASSDYVGAGGRFTFGAFNPLSELQQVVRLPLKEVVPAVVRGAMVADGTTDAVYRKPDGTTQPLRIFRNLVAYVSDGSGTVEWTRPNGTTGSIPAVDPAAFGQLPQSHP